MRHFAVALVLACVISGTVSAGEIPTTGAPAPAPPSPVVTTGAFAPGEVPSTGGTATQVLAILLTLIRIVR